MGKENIIDTTVALPTEPGVYVIRDSHLGADEQVQLDETGQWWPYPYMFSGWREGELRVMGGTWYAQPNLLSDVPEIRNPETADRLRFYNEQLASAFPEIPAERIDAFARKLTFEDWDYPTDDEED